MAQNLVPLYIDKVSGDIVASKNPTSGNAPGQPGNPNAGYEHIQLTPILTWVIPHNANTKRLICQIYDQGDMYVLPDDIQIVDENLVIVSFGVAMAGSAKIVFF